MTPVPVTMRMRLSVSTVILRVSDALLILSNDSMQSQSEVARSAYDLAQSVIVVSSRKR